MIQHNFLPVPCQKQSKISPAMSGDNPKMLTLVLGSVLLVIAGQSNAQDFPVEVPAPVVSEAVASKNLTGVSNGTESNIKTSVESAKVPQVIPEAESDEVTPKKPLALPGILFSVFSYQNTCRSALYSKADDDVTLSFTFSNSSDEYRLKDGKTPYFIFQTDGINETCTPDFNNCGTESLCYCKDDSQADAIIVLEAEQTAKGVVAVWESSDGNANLTVTFSGYPVKKSCDVKKKAKAKSSASGRNNSVYVLFTMLLVAVMPWQKI